MSQNDNANDDQGADDGDDEAVFDEATAHELLHAVIDDQSQRRMWIKAITPLLQLRSHDADRSGRVQLAFDLMHIAACERVARILRADLTGDQG